MTRNTRYAHLRTGFVLALAFLGSLTLAGCSRHDDSSFKTPQAAVDAFVAALKSGDSAELGRLLGPGVDDLLSSGDPVQDKNNRQRFIAAYENRHSLRDGGAGTMVLVIGDNDWPFPVPLVEHDGRWRLDGAAGADELVYRRVGANELGAIAVCHGFVNAENEYASQGHDGDPAGVYALKLISDEGMQNGLYWPAAEGEPPSPAGPFVAAAAAEGYHRGAERRPYHGYYYRLLYSQGANAKGGVRDYFSDGVMSQGFALIAWPADYGASGVQTFIVNQDGTVYQKDLGDDTATLAEQIESFDPDGTWTEVPVQATDAPG
jgi:hypothetical protein